MSVNAIGVIRACGRDNFRNGPQARFASNSAFTLIELLVVVAITAILAAILFPVFSSAKESGKKARCALQLKQLVAASIAYADDYSGRYVPAARDIYNFNPVGGHWRWHGYREKNKTDFDPRRGPLWNYISRSGGLKRCPSAPNLVDLQEFFSAFESGCGGFGYNHLYVGGTYYRNQKPMCAQVASLTSEIARPGRTVMFTDTAMALNNSKDKVKVLIEYSFAEPPYNFAVPGAARLVRTASPAIHFRHDGRVNVGWCDGHVTSEKMSFTSPGKNTYGCDNDAFHLGWFGPDDNSLFDNR